MSTNTKESWPKTVTQQVMRPQTELEDGPKEDNQLTKPVVDSSSANACNPTPLRMRVPEGHEKKKYGIAAELEKVQPVACAMMPEENQTPVKTSERRKISLKHIVNIFRPGNKLPSDSVDDGLRCHGNGLAGSRSSSFPTFVGIATVEHELENQEKKTKLDANCQHSVECDDDQKECLIRELRDTREQLRRYAEENTKLKNEVDTLATELYNFKTQSQVCDSPTTISDIPVPPFQKQADTLTTFSIASCGGVEPICKPKITLETLDKQMKLLEDQMTEVEQYIELHKSMCKAATRDSNYSINMRKSLNEIMQGHKNVYDISKELFAAMEIQAVEIHQLRRMLKEKEEEMTGFHRTIINLMEEERDLLESEREEMEDKKSPNVDVKTQIIQLRCGLEAKITQLQREVSLLENQKAELKMKYADLERNIERNTFKPNDQVDCGDDDVCKREPVYEKSKSENKEGQTAKLEVILERLHQIVEALSAENDKLRKEMKAVLVHTSLSENRDRQPGSHMRSDKRLSSQSRGSEFETGSFRNDPVIENVNM